MFFFRLDLDLPIEIAELAERHHEGLDDGRRAPALRADPVVDAERWARSVLSSPA